MRDLKIQSLNKLNICGKLLSLETSAGKTKTTGAPYERATAIIRVTQSVGGAMETSEIPVDFFATQFTNSGATNPMYESLQNLKKCKTIQNYGDEADTISLSRADLQENNFVTKAGQLVNGFRIRGSFFNQRVSTDMATFNVEIVILDMRDEVDRDGEETGRLIVKGALVQWGEKLDVFEFVIENPDQIDYFKRNFDVNNTAHINGRIRFTSKEVKRQSDASSWGETIEDTDTRVMRELVITGGDDEPFDDEDGYDINEIRKGFNVRKSRLEQMQIDARSKASTPKPAPKATDMDWA